MTFAKQVNKKGLKMTDQLSNLLPLFYAQLSHGCNGVTCKTKECRTCPEFLFQSKEIKDLDSCCVELALQYQENNQTSVLCKNMSPILLKPRISISLVQFLDFSQSFIHDQPVDQTISIMKSIFSDIDIFSHIFLKSDCFLKPEDLNVNIDLCSEFHEALIRRIDLFLPYKQDFLNFLSQFPKYPNIDTLHWIRGVCLLSLFTPLFSLLDKFDDMIAIVEKFTSLSELSIQIFYNFIIMNPDFIKYLNTLIHELCDKYIQEANPNPHTSLLHSITTIIELLSEANILCDKPIDQSCFVIDSLQSRIFPEFEYQLWKNNIFSYLKTPSILSVRLKNLLLKQYSRSLREENIIIQRDRIVQTAIDKVLKLPEHQLQQHLKIQFENETAQDSGGVSREFYFIIFNEFFFSENYNLFTLSEDESFYWFTSEAARQNPDTIYYQYVGTIVGLAVSNSINLPVRFPMVLYKKLYDVTLTFRDFEELCPAQAHSIKSLKKQFSGNNTDARLEDLEMYFSVTDPVTHKEVPIVPDGDRKQVTESNLDEYIDALLDYHLNTSIRKEFEAVKTGFNLSRPKILTSFRFYDLDVLISGTQVLNWAALKTNTTYANGYDERSPSVVMFWKIFNEMDDQKKELLLKFITGCSRAPAGGLEALNIVIQKNGDVSKLPTSHTCVYTLDLPDYQNEEKMRKSLDICANNAEGFGLI